MRSLFFIFLLLPIASFASDVTGIQFTEIWARPSPKLGHAGVVYAKITNTTAVDDAIISVSSPVARKVETHLSSVNEMGVMSMAHIPELLLPAGKVVRLMPSGLHIMLMGLNKQLEVGVEFPVTITFKNSPQQNIKVVVKDPREDKMKHNMRNMHK